MRAEEARKITQDTNNQDFSEYYLGLIRDAAQQGKSFIVVDNKKRLTHKTIDRLERLGYDVHIAQFSKNYYIKW